MNTTGTARHPNHTRRVPRGKTGKCNPLGLLNRQAQKDAKRIRGMISSVKGKDRRRELAALRRKLIELLQRFVHTPQEISTGTFTEVDTTMREAREIYLRAPKPKSWGRPERRTQIKGVGKKELRRMRRKDRTKPVVEEDVVTTVASPTISPSPRRHDPEGDAFQTWIDEGRPND